MWQPVDTQTNKPLELTPANWPIRIHGALKAGASFFTIALTADLIRHGQKVVFICAHGDAIRALQSELGLAHPENQSDTVTEKVETTLRDMRLVTLLKRRGVDLLASLRALSDWSERIVVIKNIEETLSPQLWAIVQPQKRLILSGDFEKEKFDIDPNAFSTSILFSTSPGYWQHQRRSLPTYIGDSLVGGEQKQVMVAEKK